MRFNSWLFWAIAGYFFIITIVYVVWGLFDKGYVEPAGTVALLLCAVFAALVAFYLTVHVRSSAEAAAQDRPDGTLEDDDPEMGFFSPWSWWPLIVGFACTVIFAGLAIGVWLAFIGGGLLLVSMVGWTYEYYRGNFAH